jgi:hypothetical protein
MNLDIVISPGYRAATAGRLCGDITPAPANQPTEAPFSYTAAAPAGPP